MSELLIPRPFSDYFMSHVTKKECSCGFKKLDQLSLRGYRHEDGWSITWGEQTLKFWLYVTCPKCHYEWAIWRLGVPRTLEFPPLEEVLTL